MKFVRINSQEWINVGDGAVDLVQYTGASDYLVTLRCGKIVHVRSGIVKEWLGKEAFH